MYWALAVYFCKRAKKISGKQSDIFQCDRIGHSRRPMLLNLNDVEVDGMGLNGKFKWVEKWVFKKASAALTDVFDFARRSCIFRLCYTINIKT